MTAAPAATPAVRRLRGIAVAVLVLAFGVAGVWKIVRPDASVTLLNRALETPRARRAGGCLELALALWLASGRSPRLAPAVAAATLAGLALLIGTELRRPHPLPCGCFPTAVTLSDRPGVRAELLVALGRDVFLIALCGLAGALANDAPSPAASTLERFA